MKRIMTGLIMLGMALAGAKDMETVKIGKYSPEQAPDALSAQAFAEALVPIRPGRVNGQAFWNGYARQFIYAPSFDFKEVANAASYRYAVTGSDGVTLTFEAPTPFAALSPVWGCVPEGQTSVRVTALDKDGKELAASGERGFYRLQPFDNHYAPKAKPYLDCAKDAYHYLLTMGAIQHMKTGKTDPDYTHYCYPSKMHASIIEGLLEYAEIVPEVHAEAVEIARQCADYLIRTAIPAGEPLEYLPLTYLVPTTEDGKKLVAASKVGTIMMIYPVEVGQAMIRLYREIGERAYLDYAVKIGEQYRRLQRADGTWALILKIADGSEVAANSCEPVDILPFLENLADATGNGVYREMARKGMGIVRERIRTFHWEGQFEDINAQVVPYSNLSKHPATSTFMMLAKHEENRTPEFIAQAREVQHFAEDQFVVWRRAGAEWRMAPAALEQYNCYAIVDASVAKMIRYYLFMYDLEKKPLDLAKARALGDSLTRAQVASGRIPTWYYEDKYVPGGDWINCMFASAYALKLLSRYDNITLN